MPIKVLETKDAPRQITEREGTFGQKRAEALPGYFQGMGISCPMAD